MSNQISQKLDILPQSGKIIANMYSSMNKDFIYTEQMINLLHESRNCFSNNAPLSSIIVAGEACFRFLLDKVISFVKVNGDLTFKQGKKSKKILSNDLDKLHSLYDELNFSTVTKIIVAKFHIDVNNASHLKMIRELRNTVVHSDLPVLLEWDPDEPREKEELIKIINNDDEISEGWKFKCGGNDYHFTPKQFQCKTLNGLSVPERFAAIQYSNVVKVLESI